jgi:hypothetical protein
MMNTLLWRKRAATALLFVSGLMAIYLALPGDSVGVKQTTSGLSPAVNLLDRLNAREVWHLLGHVVVFGGAAALLTDWGPYETPGQEGGGPGLALRYTLAGALFMEGGQAIVGYSDDTAASLFWGTVFDLAVDGAAVALALIFMAGLFHLRYHKRLKTSRSKGL